MKEWSKSFKRYGFREELQEFIYNDIESFVLKNRWSSDFSTLQRGVRQGCPLSPYLFILSVEVLGKSISANSSIKGITVNNTEIKISQYADDTTLIL